MSVHTIGQSSLFLLITINTISSEYGQTDIIEDVQVPSATANNAESKCFRWTDWTEWKDWTCSYGSVHQMRQKMCQESYDVYIMEYTSDDTNGCDNVCLYVDRGNMTGKGAKLKSANETNVPVNVEERSAQVYDLTWVVILLILLLFILLILLAYTLRKTKNMHENLILQRLAQE
ncbi:hypothetical protein Btru_014813 [Bulinus truncatus]|nr:hypothetical protein Btru_014813 [Bulinus truncatus]